MLIRPATNADAETVRSLIFGVLAEYGLLAEHEGVDADLSDIEGNYIIRGGMFDLVFDENDVLVGTVGLFACDRPSATSGSAPPRRTAELRKMYLAKHVRGRGIGRTLLERALTRARELGFGRIELETSSKLMEAIGLYRGYGFQRFQPDHIACRCDQAWFLDLA